MGRAEEIAAEKGCKPSQVALAWVLAQGDDVLAIVGTRYKHRLDENLGALRLQLSADDLARISAAIPAGASAGSRYPAEAMRAIYLNAAIAASAERVGKNLEPPMNADERG